MKTDIAVVGACRARAAGCLALGVSAALLFALGGCSGGAKPEPALVFNPGDSLHVAGYVFGRDLGKSIPEMRELGVQFNDSMVLLGLREVLQGVPAQMPDSALAAATTLFHRGFRGKQRQRRRQIEEENMAKATAFLEEHKSTPGVVVTASGLQYVVLKEGAGPKPKVKDRVKIHYRGTVPDGTVFDSSVDRGEPASVVVGEGLQGWTEVLQIMKTGAKYKVVVPPNLGYGRRNMRPPLGPNSVLVYELELIEIEKPEVAKK